MLIFLIIILAVVLSTMFWHYRKQERKWRAEMQALAQTRTTVAQTPSPVTPDTALIDDNTGSGIAEHVPEQALAFTPNEETIETPTEVPSTAAAETQPEKKHTPVFSSIQEINPFFNPQPIANHTEHNPIVPPEKLNSFAFELIDSEPPEVITLEEATRNLRNLHDDEQNEINKEHDDDMVIIAPEFNASQKHESFHKPKIENHQHDENPQKNLGDLEVITLADAMRAMHEHEEETHSETPKPHIYDRQPENELRYEDLVVAAAVRERTLQHEPRPSPRPLPADTETIDMNEIRDSLLRQRLARHQQMLAEAPVHSVLRVIPEDEVLANLARTDSPINRRRKRNKPTSVEELSPPVPQQIQTEYRSGVAHNPYPRMRKTKTVIQQPSIQTNNMVLSRFTKAPTPPAVLNEEPVSINEPVIVPPPTIEAPEIVEQPFHFPVAPSIVAQPLQIKKIKTAASNHTKPIKPSINETTELAEEYHDLLDVPSPYPLPDASLLLPPQHNSEAIQSEEQLLNNGITIEEKLAEFRVKVKVIDAYAGPVITRYEIEPDTGVRGNSVLNLEKDLARSLGMASIRVVETIPGKNCMGIELPNPKRQIIRISEIFNSPAFTGSRSKLTLALGQDITGEPVVMDLAKAPHMLVAGTTGSGKSVGINSMILSLLFKAAPEEVRLIMIDPKMLELSVYEGIPHLLTPVITDMKYAANALNWCVNEMEKRYRLMSHLGVRNITGYNKKIVEAGTQGQHFDNPFSLTPETPEPLEKLPFIVVVVDEFADLMMVAGKQIEQLISRLAQKARAAGIHLILATQRPSVDVITGLIKANIPTRIAFQVSSKVDSRTILDQMGAENLLGQGDMLFLPPGMGYPQRVHGAFVEDSEVHGIVEYLKQFGEPHYVDDIITPNTHGEQEFALTLSTGHDPLFDEAVATVLRTQKTSISSLQRYLRIGYNKAATLVEQMEAEGIVSAADSSGKRTILARNDTTPTDN